jgi:hypothetical protein
MSGEGASDLALEKTVSAEDAGVTPGGANVDSGRLATGTRLGRYEIVEFIGGGGMGWVYRATDTELEREVAIKVVQPTVAGPKGRDRLLAEARAMAKLRHRAVVPVFDVGEYAGGVYVAMALVKGGTLHDWMHAEARPWRQVRFRWRGSGPRPGSGARGGDRASRLQAAERADGRGRRSDGGRFRNRERERRGER